MLEVEAVKAMLEASGTTLAGIATHYNVPLSEVYGFAREHGITEPTLESPGCRSLRKLCSAQYGKTAEHWERLLWDDEAGSIVNGIDTSRMDGKINAVDIVRYYHGCCNCLFTGEPTDSVMAADGHQANILISNLMPLTKQVGDKRFNDTAPFIVDKQYTITAPDGRGIRVSITLDMWFDKLLSDPFNEIYVDHAVEHWLEPYLSAHSLIDILSAYDLPATPTLVCLWIWRQLSTKALLKGLARVKLEQWARPTAYVTKQAVLFQTKKMIERQLGRRNIVTPLVQPAAQQQATGSRLIQL